LQHADFAAAIQRVLELDPQNAQPRALQKE
jgi:hypothetical protein